MANCEDCIHKYVCKNYPVDSLPPIIRQSIFKKLDAECKEFIGNADANLVVHGEWKEDYDTDSQDYNSDNNWWLRCSCCQNHTKINFRKQRFDYCPNCGTKMDGRCCKMSTDETHCFKPLASTLQHFKI